MSEKFIARRYYLQKSREAKKAGDDGLVGGWIAKHAAEAASLLPPGFPFLEKLQAVRYFAREDLDGADEDELVEEAGLTRREAKAVLSALAKLTG